MGSAGDHEVVWNARSSDGSPVAGGTYLARVSAQGETNEHKVLILNR